MSTNKTEKYHLHAWEPGDDFLLSEVNENFALLDTAVRMEIGFYTGSYDYADGPKGQTIELGFMPRAVLVLPHSGTLGARCEGGLALPGCPVLYGSRPNCIEVVENGFRVYSDKDGTMTNWINTTYYYLALQ